MAQAVEAPAGTMAEGPTSHTQNQAAKTGGALAIRPDQTNWTPEQAAVLRQSGIDNEVTGAELASFLHLCQRTQLDPFSRQIYLIGRWDKRAGRKVFTPQTSIDGYRVTAHRAASKAGHKLGYEDTVWCDSSGKWFDVWLSTAPPAAAKVVVVRDGQRFPAVAKYSEYVQTNKENKPIGLWGKMPATMTAKCAEALALRMAFPNDLAGVYTAEEMAQADNPEPEQRTTVVQSPPMQRERRDYLAEAQVAESANVVRALWQEAKQAGAPTDYLDQIAAVGRELAADLEARAAAYSGDPEPADYETDHSRPGEETRAAPLDPPAAQGGDTERSAA